MKQSACLKYMAAMGIAGALAVAASGATVYQVTDNIISGGIDLTTGGYDPLSLAGPASGDIYMTGTVVHAAATVSSPFQLVGKGGGLNLTSSGLLSSPLKITGTSGYFDFQNENIALGDDWRDRLQLPAYSANFYVSFKTFDVAGGTDASWLVFDPDCRLYFDGTSSIGYKGGGARVKAVLKHNRGCHWNDGRSHKRINGKINLGGVDSSGGAPGYVHLEVTNGTFYCYQMDIARNVTAANSLQASQGITNVVTIENGGVFYYGNGLTRHGPEWVHVRFAGGYFQQNGYYGELFQVADDPNDAGGYVLESIDGSGISVYPHSSSCGTGSRLETRGGGNFHIGGNGTDANENILGNKITWNHAGKVYLGADNKGSLRIAGENALPYGEGKNDVAVDCKYLCLDASQTVNSIYGNGQAYARNSGVTVTVGAHGGDCRYKMPVKMAIGATISYNGNGTISTRTNYGWDVAKIGAGTMTLETSVQKTLAVNEGAVSVTAAEAEVPTLTMAAGTSLSVASGGTLALGAFDNVNGAEVSVKSGGTLLFIAGEGETRSVDLSGYSLAVGAVVGSVGAGRVVFQNLPSGACLFAKEGELEVGSVAAGSRSEQPAITVADGALLVIDAGVALKTVSLAVCGAQGEAKTTYGGGGAALAGLSGDGSVTVAARTATWTGAGADSNISTPENWEGGEAPAFGLGAQNVVFPADAARRDVIVDTDAAFAGVVLGGASYSFTGADAVFSVGTNGLSVAEPADAAGATYDFAVKVAQSGHGAWRMPTASAASKIYFRRPLVDGAAPGRIYMSGTTFYFHSTNSTYTGDVYVTNAATRAVYAYGALPFGSNGTLRVRSNSSNYGTLTLTDTKICNNVELDISSNARRKSIEFAGATNEFCGAYYNLNSEADNNCHKGVVIFRQGYGRTGNSSSYVNWDSNYGTGVIHMYGPLLAGTVQPSGNEVHFHCASNTFSYFHGWNATYSPVTASSRFHFYVDDAFWRTDYRMAAYGTWDFHGTEQRVGSLLCDNDTLYLRSSGGPGRLRCRQTEYFSNLAKSRRGVADFIAKAVFQDEMSFTLEEGSTRKLVMTGVSTATGTVEVAGGTLCFTNGASWAFATNVIVRGTGVLEAYDANALGDGTADLRFADSAKWDGHGTVQKVHDLYFNGVRQPQGFYCARDYPGPTSGMRKTDFITGTGRIHVYGDGYGTSIIFR